MDWQPTEGEGEGRAEGAATGSGSGGSRVKRKMAKQLRFLSKLQKTQTLLSAKKTIGKKKKGKRNRDISGRTFNNLSSLAEFLPTFGDKDEAPVKRKAKTLRSKARRDIVLDETKQLAAVLSHPTFKSNPFSAIQQHLTNTLPPPADASDKKHKKAKVSSSKKKGKKPPKSLVETHLSMDVE